MQAASVSLAVGSLVWVEDPDAAWLDGEVVEINGDNIKVLCTSGKMVGALVFVAILLNVPTSFHELNCNDNLICTFFDIIMWYL